MNNVQLDMVLGYLNEGTEIDTISFLAESINESIENFEIVSENMEIINEGFVDKIKSILQKIWDFIAGIASKVADFAHNMISKIKNFIIKKKAEQQKKKVQKEAVTPIKVPYYESNGETVEVGQLASTCQEFFETLNEDILADSVKLYEEIIKGGNTDDMVKGYEEGLENLKEYSNGTFEIKYRDQRGNADPDLLKIEIAQRLLMDITAYAKVIDFNKQMTKKTIDKLRSTITDVEHQNDVHRVTRILSDSAKMANKVTQQRISAMQKVALGYLGIGKTA